MNNKIETQSGERLTFFNLFKEKGYQIEIPIIQRDYAQGRPSTFEVRNSFLDALYIYLEENKKNRDLDFIYGSLITTDDGETKFVPLDGQQRLTTLFLLHFYLALKDDMVHDFRDILLNDDKSKFTYETRVSSREFCDALLINDIDLNNLLAPDKDKKNDLSKTIKDQNWFYSSWENDPTIQAMLVMLDSIHYKFRFSSGYYERLVRKEGPVITFQFLNLQEFKLTDELYIKMNARGKPLTPFENFKAKFEQLLRGPVFQKIPDQYFLSFNGSDEQVSLQEYFSHKIDTDWANLFWNYRNLEKHTFDDQVMNLIRTWSICHLGEFSDSSGVKYLLNKEHENVSFQKYTDLKCFDESFVVSFINLLDLLKNGEEEIKSYLPDSYYFDENRVFKNLINASYNDAAYVDRLLFYAYTQFLIKWESNDGLEAWMRIIKNLVGNTAPYNDEKEFVRSIIGIKKLLPNSRQVVQYFANSPDKIDGFNGEQFREEILKSKLILKGSMWSNLIIQSEQEISYLNGQLTSVLSFSQIYDIYETNTNLDWELQKETELKDSFIHYIKCLKSIFNPEGLKEFRDFVWQRALLSKGFYLIPEGRNHSFLINSDRDISWKRLLLGDKKNGKKKRQYVKELFDDKNFNLGAPEGSLDIIVEQAINEIDDWRRHFISFSEMLNYLGSKKYIRYNSKSEINLLAGERISGDHREYYSYGFFLENLRKEKFSPFSNNWYYSVSGESEQSCAVIDGWKYNGNFYALYIQYNGFFEEYQIAFLCREAIPIEEEIEEVLKTNGFTYSENNSQYFKKLDDEQELITNLNLLCREFQDITSGQEVEL